MFKITHKQIINQNQRIDILAPQIARYFKPGQFVMVTAVAGARPIPFVIFDADERKGTISLILHETGRMTRQLGELSINDPVHLVQGPLGRPATIDRCGLVVCIATGIGAAQIMPVARALKKAGNRVYGIVGAKNKRAMMLEAQLRVICDEITITTNDGTYERRGLATEVLQEILDKHTVNRVYAIGSVEMMQAACAMTLPRGIKTLVTVTPKMVDGTGICGSCRVVAGGESHLACQDGPEFDGHTVDFQYLEQRMHAFKECDEWGNLNPPNSPRKNESGILGKFLSGIRK